MSHILDVVLAPQHGRHSPFTLYWALLPLQMYLVIMDWIINKGCSYDQCYFDYSSVCGWFWQVDRLHYSWSSHSLCLLLYSSIGDSLSLVRLESSSKGLSFGTFGNTQVPILTSVRHFQVGRRKLAAAPSSGLRLACISRGDSLSLVRLESGLNGLSLGTFNNTQVPILTSVRHFRVGRRKLASGRCAVAGAPLLM